MEEKNWVIYSFEHEGWWGYDERGYTDFEDAGAYTESEAKQIEKDANKYCKNGKKNELAMSRNDALIWIKDSCETSESDQYDQNTCHSA